MAEFYVRDSFEADYNASNQNEQQRYTKISGDSFHSTSSRSHHHDPEIYSEKYGNEEYNNAKYSARGRDYKQERQQRQNSRSQSTRRRSFSTPHRPEIPMRAKKNGNSFHTVNDQMHQNNPERSYRPKKYTNTHENEKCNDVTSPSELKGQRERSRQKNGQEYNSYRGRSVSASHREDNQPRVKKTSKSFHCTRGSHDGNHSQNHFYNQENDNDQYDNENDVKSTSSVEARRKGEVQRRQGRNYDPSSKSISRRRIPRSTSRSSVGRRYRNGEGYSAETLSKSGYDVQHSQESSSREYNSRSKSRGRARSISRGYSSHDTDGYSNQQTAKPKPHVVSINGVPFDKNGCCFMHPHIKLASKKVLGGWKVHHTFCKACALESQYVVRQSSVGSPRLDVHTSYPNYSRGAERQYGHSHQSNGLLSSTGSMQSVQSNGSASSFHTDEGDDSNCVDSSLPMDPDGYCIHHPDMQLARLGRKGDWKVLLDFCPACAEESLQIGGAVSSKPRQRSCSRSAHRVRDYDSSSNDSSSSKMEERITYVKNMPFVDENSEPGHYTGYLNMSGTPSGSGKMKYLDGKKFEGMWENGCMVHGKVSYKKNNVKSKPHSSSRYGDKRK